MEFYIRRFADPDERIDQDALTSSMLNLGGMTISYEIRRPGRRWSTHVRPHVKTEWCRMRHVGVVLTETMHYLLDDGREFEVGPMTLHEVPPGHDAWVVGDELVATLAWGCPRLAGPTRDNGRACAGDGGLHRHHRFHRRSDPPRRPGLGRPGRGVRGKDARNDRALPRPRREDDR